MERIRFSMAGLMGFVLLLAVGLAALKSANKIWAGVITMLALGLLLLAILGVFHTAGPRRRFWSAFALFGLMYLMLIYSPWFSKHVGGDFPTTDLLEWLYANMAKEQSPPIDSGKIAIWIKSDGTYWVDGRDVADDAALIDLITKLGPGKSNPNKIEFFDRGTNDKTVNAGFKRLIGLMRPVGNRSFTRERIPLSPDWGYFIRVGHSLIALLVGMVGGVLARLVFRCPEQKAAGAGAVKVK